MLSIQQLKVKSILKGLNLQIREGERVVLMGPNGSGKSTLAQTIAGSPTYPVDSGKIEFNGVDITVAPPEERAQAGIWLAFQYPPSIPGVSVSQLLRLSLHAQQKARGETLTPSGEFLRLLRDSMKLLNLHPTFANRSIHEDFSGGEKKRLEVLQMLVLQPKLVILDEVDSGLDIDGLRLVLAAIKELPKSTSVLIITHYPDQVEKLAPDTVHIMRDGQITRSGGPEIVKDLAEKGYQK